MKNYGFVITVSILIIIPIFAKQVNPRNRVCYYAGSAQDDFMPESINATLCTHIIFGFARVENGSVSTPGQKDVEKFKSLLALKETNPNLNVMISIGENGRKLGGFSDSLSYYSVRKQLVNSILKFAQTYNFTGIDFDWEFPSWAGSPLADQANFVIFLKELREAINIAGTNLILSAAVAAPETIVFISYDIPGLAEPLDFINLMTYDFHIYQWYDPFVGHNSPLFNRTIEKFAFATLNTAWAAENWAKQGMPKNKINIGIPNYGYAYKLLDSSYHDLDAPAISGIGQWNFPQVCEFLASGAKRVFDQESQVPYAYKDDIWLGYDDIESVTAKSQWVKQNEYGGVMTWDLNSDDWQNKCGLNKFPLHTAIYNTLVS